MRLNFVNMKTIYFSLFLVAAAVLSSCSETNIIEKQIVIDETIDAPPVSGQFKKRVLIEDYTGTWCGNCTRVSYGIEKVFESTERAVAVAIHNGNDPYHFDGIGPLKNLISPEYDLELPQSRLNRTVTWEFPEPQNIQQAINLTSNNCGLGLALHPTVANGNISVDVAIKFVQNYTDVKLVVYLLEDNLTYYQANYTTYFGAVNPVLNFDHDHVLRASLTNIMGDAITEATVFGTTVTKNFSVPVPANIENAANLSFVAFVVGNDNKVINVRSAHTDENQEFEENP